MAASSFSYHKFVNFAMEEARRRITDIVPLPLPDKYKCIVALDHKTEIRTLSFQAPKIRMLRNLTIDGGQSMQVLDFAVFPEPEFDLPIFCANFFTAASMNIVVLDLNPLHDVITDRDYKEKYYKNLIPLGQKYVDLLPWGDKITSESLRFFSPVVIWTRFTSSQQKHDILYSAFVDYFKAWLRLMEQAVAETDTSQIFRNRAAQHKYLTWRAEKDPGHPILTRLLGDDFAKDLVRNFLFNGCATLSDDNFLDYFPEYECEGGTISKKRSMMGKAFKNRPWDANGEYIGDGSR